MQSSKKIAGAWIVMDVKEIRDVSTTISHVIGPIVNSNFLPPADMFAMPVLATAFQEINTGDRVKIVCFTTVEELTSFKKGKICEFEDDGIIYYIHSDDGWRLFYEDYS